MRPRGRTMAKGGRVVPRPFSLPWGKGHIIEEAAALGRYHEPALQLMRFDDGTLGVRFCYYGHGRFQRSPLILGTSDCKALRDALRQTPRLRSLLHQLVPG